MGKHRPTKTGLYKCHRVGCNWERETTLRGWQKHNHWCNKPEPAGKIVRQDPYANTVPLSSRTSSTTTDDNSFTSGICGLIHQHEAYQKSSEDVEMQDREHFNETRTHIDNRYNPQPNIQERIRTAIDTNNKNESTKTPPQNDANDNADFGGGITMI